MNNKAFASLLLIFVLLLGCDETQQIVLGPIMNGVSEDDALVEADISYYRDWNFTERLTDTIEVGTTVYTKVVLSRTDVLKDVAVVDFAEVQPNIFFNVGLKSSQYRMVPSTVAYEDMQSGDARSHEVTEGSFVCKYVVQTRNFGETFVTSVDNRPIADRQLRVVFFTYLSDEAPEHKTDVQGSPQDFVGVVCVPTSRTGTVVLEGETLLTGTVRKSAQPVSNAFVTIMSGPRYGEQVSTDHTGKYVFPNVDGNELHLLVEKEFFEPKEATVFRDGPTLVNGNTPLFYDPQYLICCMLRTHRLRGMPGFMAKG